MSSKGSGGKSSGLRYSYAIPTRSRKVEEQLRSENAKLRKELAQITDEIEASTDEKLKQWLQEFIRKI